MTSQQDQIHPRISKLLTDHLGVILEKWKFDLIDVRGSGGRGGYVVFAGDGMRLRVEFDGRYLTCWYAFDDAPEEWQGIEYAIAFFSGKGNLKSMDWPEMATRLDIVMPELFRVAQSGTMKNELREWTKCIFAKAFDEKVAALRSKFTTAKWWEIWKK